MTACIGMCYACGRISLKRLEELNGKRLDLFHIMSGGTQNCLLNQFTADATGRTVIAGPVEATAIGNILMQAIGLKHLASLSEAPEVVCLSFEPEIYEPNPTAVGMMPVLDCRL